MTAKCQVLSVGFEGQYFEEGVNANYWEEGGEAPGQWYGSGARALRLPRMVRGETFQRLLDGKHPHQERSLIQRQKQKSQPEKENTKAEHRPGFDLQFSVPKSLSATWAVASESNRRKIEQSMDCAVRDTLSYAEENIPLARQGKRGAQRVRAKLVVAMYDHVTSRNGDPLLHRHCVVTNVCQRPDGSWATIDSRALHRWTRTLGPIFRANLAAELRKRTGLELVEAKTPEGKSQGWFEVAGVPATLTQLWSSRRRQIMQHVNGALGSLGRNSAKAMERASLETRSAKAVTPPRKYLMRKWQIEAAQHGFTEQTVESLFRRNSIHTQSGDEYQRAWAAAIEDVTTSESHFTERRLIQAVVERLQTGLFSGNEIAKRVSGDLAMNTDIVPLAEFAGDKRYTTREIWNREKEFLSLVSKMQKRSGATVNEKILKRLAGKHQHLDQEQLAAAKTLLTQDSAIRIMTGVAGAGKSTTLAAVKDGLEAAGYNVIGGALSGAAKEELAEKTNMPSRTIASYLYHLEKDTTEKIADRLIHDGKQLVRAAVGLPTSRYSNISLDSKSVLILDEAGMLGTETLLRLLRHVEKAGATAILVGDTKQLQPIDGGGPLKYLSERFQTAHLSVNRRQQDPADKAAVAALREGRTKEALTNYAERGRLSVGLDRSHAVRNLVAAWSRAGGCENPAQHYIFTQTRAEAVEVNRHCQKVMLKGSRTPRILSVRHGEEHFYRGDRVLFHKPFRQLGIENGYRGTVASLDPIRRELKVRLDRENEPGKSKKQKLVTVPLKELGTAGITLGYASTTHKSQGATVDHSYILVTGSQTDSEMMYVQATRARHSTRFFVDQAHAGEEFRDLIAAASKSRSKVMAHDDPSGQKSQLQNDIQQNY